MRAILLLVVLSVAAAGASPAAAAAPTAITNGADATSTSSRMNGYVVPGGEETTFHFQWGTTAGYGQQTPTTPVDQSYVGGCAGCHPVDATIEGLAGSTTYHFRLVATNASGTHYGEDRTFTTQPPLETHQPPADSDGDGWADNADPCPGQPGGNGGCPPPPDGDADGVPDMWDSCPNEAGPNNGCPLATNPTGPVDDPNDVDRDGVANAVDKCAHTFDGEKVDERGCGAFLARASLLGRSTDDMADVPKFHVQCENGAGRQCTVRLTVTLSAASARRLGVRRKVASVKFTTDKSTFEGRYVYNTRSAGFGKAVRRAFRRAHSRGIAVTMTFTGSYALGSGPMVKLPRSTFTVRRKPPGTGAYVVYPSIEHGDKGSSATGLTRPKSSGDDW